MHQTSDGIIAERRRWSLAAWLGLAAAVWGLAAAVYYWRLGLTLSHYDARGHLVVARRILDSLTPGWVQVGAVWLPLPHLLNMLPVQVDFFYRTGASAVAISIAAFALLVYACARLIREATGSGVAAVATAVLVATNPNLLYLQSTPMTEPLLLGLVGLGLALLYEGVNGDDRRRRRLGFLALAFACLTRYEAWPITGAAIIAVAMAEWRRHGGVRRAVSEAAQLAVIPLVGILWFFVHRKATVGARFVTGGFYVPDPRYQGKALAVTAAIWWGVRALGSDVLGRTGLAAAVGLAALWVWKRKDSALIVPLAWLGAMALAWYAFFEGHPFRIRYLVPSVTAAAVLTGLGLGRLPRRWQAPVAVVLVSLVLWQTHPFDPKAPMVLEAQWDAPRSRARRAVTACLPPPGHGEIIMASMGSLAHYMQDLSAQGFAIRDFLHEGNGALWQLALGSPRRYVRWILIEEVSEGGDMLAQRARANPRFLEGFTCVCEGGGVALYKLQERVPRVPGFQGFAGSGGSGGSRVP
jgi:hypothetical protein